jgi:hypothetical protein
MFIDVPSQITQNSCQATTSRLCVYYVSVELGLQGSSSLVLGSDVWIGVPVVPVELVSLVKNLLGMPVAYGNSPFWKCQGSQ